jgi:SAM-dependent methyltransferase
MLVDTSWASRGDDVGLWTRWCSTDRQESNAASERSISKHFVNPLTTDESPHGSARGRTTLETEVVIDDTHTRLTDHDPLAGSAWSDARTVEGFVQSPPNTTLMDVAAAALGPSARLLDIGCGAGRNAVPLARAGWRVVGSDLSSAMLTAAAGRVRAEAPSNRVDLVLAPMESLPFASNTFDFVVAHGIWNLARSGQEFRSAVVEAARVARPGAPLFLFTFSRHTLAESAAPVPGESFVFTQFSGQPQCFLTAEQICTELGKAGFTPDPAYLLRESNRPPGGLRTSGAPVIYEGVFRCGRG